MWTLYENIQTLCEERGIKGGKMCVDLGLSKSLMTDLKSGRKKSINSETAKKIAEYFGVSIDRVVGGIDKEKAPTHEGKRNEGELGLSDIYFSLAKDLQDAKIDPEDIRNFANIIAKNMKKNKESHE